MLLVQIKRPRLIALVAAASLAGVMLITAAPTAVAENNGVGATPAMGWSSWSFIRHNPTAANIDAQADAMKSSGLATVGYNYVNIDDFWYQCPGSQGPNVDANGRWVFAGANSTLGAYAVSGAVLSGPRINKAVSGSSATNLTVPAIFAVKPQFFDPAPAITITAQFTVVAL